MSIASHYDRTRELAIRYPFVAMACLAVFILFLDLFRKLWIGNVAVSYIGTLVWDGLMQGLIIGLAGIGLSMTYSILNFANFGHGDYITAGAFAGWGISYLIAGLGTASIGDLLLLGAGGTVYGPAIGLGVTSTPMAVVLGLITAALATVAIALFIDRFVYRSMRDAGGIPLLIASIGVAFALRYSIVFVFKPEIRGTTAAGAVPQIPLMLIDGNVLVDAHDITLLIIAIALMFTVHIFLQWTKLGKAMRAMADNKDLALITGIPTDRVVRWTWIIGGGLAGIAGYLTVLWRGTIGFQLGWLLLLLIFAAVILGGIGSIYGAIVGGILIGLSMNLSQVWIPSDFMQASAFAIMIIVLLFRPQGIFGGKMTA